MHELLPDHQEMAGYTTVSNYALQNASIIIIPDIMLKITPSMYVCTSVYNEMCYNITCLHTYISLSTVVLNSRDRHKKHGVPLFRASTTCLTIKTHGSESRGQEKRDNYRESFYT